MSPETVRVVRRLCAVALLVVVAGPAAAQTPDPPTLPSVIPVAVAPLPWLVVDVRGGLPSLGQDLITAGDLGVAAADLPSRAKALVVGAHAYPIRRESFKVGFGAEVLLGSASSQKKDAQGEPAGPVVHRRVDSLSTRPCRTARGVRRSTSAAAHVGSIGPTSRSRWIYGFTSQNLEIPRWSQPAGSVKRSSCFQRESPSSKAQPSVRLYLQA
jgi:hypothetical protein